MKYPRRADRKPFGLLSVIFSVLVASIFWASLGFARVGTDDDCVNDWATPIAGDVCFDTTVEWWYYYNGTSWVTMDPPASTVAGLSGTCIEGDLRRLTDGDAAGAIVQCGGTAPADANTWYCTDFYDKQIINIACPPWNADADNADNSTEIQAALTKQETGADTGIWYTIYIPTNTYKVTSGLVYDSNRAGLANTTGGLTIVGAAKGLSRIQCDYTGADPCFTVGGSGAVQNLISFRHFSFVDGSANTPDKMVRCLNCAQTVMDSMGFGDAAVASLEFNQGTHTRITNSLFAHESALYIQLATTQDVTIDGNAIEAIDNGSSVFVSITGVASSEIAITNNHQRGGELAKFVDCGMGATGDLEGLIVSDNSTLETGIGIDCTPTGGGTVNRAVFTNNAFRGIDDGSSTTCIDTVNVSDVIVSENVCKDFPKANQQRGTAANVRWTNNTTVGSTHTDTAFTVENVLSNAVIDGLNCQAGTRCVQTVGATITQSQLSNVRFTDATTLALTTKFNLSGWISSDSNVFTLAPGVQRETCADGTSPTLTLRPYYDTTQLGNDDTDEACVVTVSEDFVSHGTRFCAAVVDDPNTNGLTFNDTSGVTEMAGNFTALLWDSICFVYAGDVTADRWVETTRSDNSP